MSKDCICLKCRWVHALDGIMVLPFCGETGMTLRWDWKEGECPYFKERELKEGTNA